MSKQRILFQNWIVELGRDPDIPINSQSDYEFIPLDQAKQMISDRSEQLESEKKRLEFIQEEVERALSELDEDEREFIERFYYMGESYRMISEQSGRPIYKLEAIHRRSVQRLKKGLRKTVAELYGVTDNNTELKCIICDSKYADEIDLIISQRDRTKTWRPVIREIKRRFDLIIKSPQLLIGHKKYH